MTIVEPRAYTCISMFTSTHTVQRFVRTAAFFFTLIVFSPFIFGIFTAATATESPGGFIIGVVISILAFWAASIISSMFYILPEWERLVLLRLGKYVGVRGPGFFVIPPFIYSVANIVDTRIMTHQVEATATLTKDNVPTRVTAAIEFEVESPKKAVVDTQDFIKSVTWLSTEALKNTIGSLDLRELLSNRDEIASQLRQQIDESAANYGINVRAVRITDIDTPPELIEELAVIARARRAAQAKQIQADAEIAVANKMAEASKILSSQAGGFKLREIQNLAEISKEESSMIIIYPGEPGMGQQIAGSSVALHDRAKAAKVKRVTKPSVTASEKREILRRLAK